MKEKAQAYFSLGENLFEAEHYNESAEAFMRAYDTYPHYTVLANIGLAYERSGAYPLAITYFEKYLSALRTAGKENPRIEEIFEKTRNKVSELIITTEGFCAECRIVLDGEDRGTSPISAVVHPGAHSIRVMGEGKMRIAETMSLAPGETRRYTISKLDALVIQRPAETKDEGMCPAFWTVTATGLASAVASGILWGATFKTKKAFDNQDEISEKRRLKDRGEKFQIGAAVATGIAGAAVITSAVLAGVHAVSSKRSANNETTVRVSNGLVGVEVQF